MGFRRLFASGKRKQSRRAGEKEKTTFHDNSGPMGVVDTVKTWKA